MAVYLFLLQFLTPIEKNERNERQIEPGRISGGIDSQLAKALRETLLVFAAFFVNLKDRQNAAER